MNRALVSDVAVSGAAMGYRAVWAAAVVLPPDRSAPRADILGVGGIAPGIIGVIRRSRAGAVVLSWQGAPWGKGMINRIARRPSYARAAVAQPSAATPYRGWDAADCREGAVS